MNSGCYGTDISKILLSIKVIDEKGEEKEIPNKDINFCYRGSAIPKNYIILSAILKGSNSPKNSIEKKQKELIQRKKILNQARLKQGVVRLKMIVLKRHGNLLKNLDVKNFLLEMQKFQKNIVIFLLTMERQKLLISKR